MLLQVGELARRSGLTVRTLHHYDEIGLLKPSGRSEAGYRLYNRSDVQRLHGIQALRHMGLQLAHIAQLLGDEQVDPQQVLSQHIHALDLQIQQATELRERLTLMQKGLVAGAPPDMGNWLETLALMSTYGKYFNAAELKRIFERWRLIESEWLPLSAQMHNAMKQGLTIDAPEVQRLANRWMVLMLEWMGGDLDLMERWGHMYRQEPTTHSINQAPSAAMIQFVEKAIALRTALVHKYLTREETSRLGFVSAAQWQALENEVQALLGQGATPQSPAGQIAGQHWNGLMNQLCRNDLTLRAKLTHAWACEPLLRAGSTLSTPVREFIVQATAGLDPHVT